MEKNKEKNMETTMENELKNKKCIPCSGAIPPLSPEEKKRLKKEIHPDWMFTHEDTRLKRSFHFKNFVDPMELAKSIGMIAEEEWHHPELHIGYGHLHVEIWTHKINNLVESDFIFAAKVDELSRLKSSPCK